MGVVWVEACRWWEKQIIRTVMEEKQFRQEEGKKEEWRVKEDSILEKVVSPNIKTANKL